MKKLIFFPLLAMIAGCQTAPVRDVLCSPDVARNPAALSCESIFRDFVSPEASNRLAPSLFIAPEAKVVEAAINDLSKYGSPGERWTYIETVESHYRLMTGNPVVRLGQVLLERRQLGDSTASILTKLGYRDQYGYLLPPRNLALLYRRLYVMLLESAQAAGLDRHDVILPAFVFLNRENNRDLLFVSPGIDPLPDSTKWELPAHVGELNSEQFGQMIGSRKFILEPQMLAHDIGHLVDLIERPKYHVVYRKYVEARTAFLRTYKAPAGVEKFGLFDRHMDQIVNEWIYLPESKNQSKISKVIPEFDPNKISSLESLKDKYRRLPPKQLKLMAQKFLRSRYLLFSSHGGGTRDTSYERSMRSSNAYDAFAERVEGIPRDVQWVKDRPDLPPIHFDEQHSVNRFLKDQAPGLFERLNMSLDPEPQGAVLGGFAEAASKLGSQGDIEAGRNEVIAIHLAEIESRVQAGLLFHLTPEQIVLDVTNIYTNKVEKYVGSPTYQYFSTYPKGSATRYLFVDRFYLAN